MCGGSAFVMKCYWKVFAGEGWGLGKSQFKDSCIPPGHLGTGNKKNKFVNVSDDLNGIVLVRKRYSQTLCRFCLRKSKLSWGGSKYLYFL